MSNPENDDEILAKEWLVSFTGDPESVRQPDCDPPDFVLNGDIAVEVTRISEGDETSLHSLQKVAEEALAELGPPGNGSSLCVMWVYESTRSFPRPNVVSAEDVEQELAAGVQEGHVSELADGRRGGRARRPGWDCRAARSISGWCRRRWQRWDRRTWPPPEYQPTPCHRQQRTQRIEEERLDNCR